MVLLECSWNAALGVLLEWCLNPKARHRTTESLCFPAHNEMSESFLVPYNYFEIS